MEPERVRLYASFIVLNSPTAQARDGPDMSPPCLHLKQISAFTEQPLRISFVTRYASDDSYLYLLIDTLPLKYQLSPRCNGEA